MRVVVFTGYFLPHPGGVEHYIFEVYRHLRGVKTTIVTVNTEGAPAEEIIDSLRVIRLPGWNLVGRSYPIPKPTIETLHLLRALWQEQFDVVNTHTRFFLTSLIGLLFAKTKGTPLLHTEHGSGHTRHSRRAVELAEMIFSQTLGRLVFMFADRVIGVSQASAAFATKLGARQPVSFVYNGVDTDHFQRRPTDLKGQLGIPHRAPVISFVGRLMTAKGPDLLVRSFKELNSNAHLLTLGEGPMQQALEALAGDHPRIHLLGSIARERISEYLSMTDILVLPTTTHPEGLPTSVLEAGACRCAVIATDRGGTREVIRHMETGLLIQPDAKALTGALQTLLHSRKLRHRLAHNLYTLVIQAFSWDRLAPQFLQQLIKTYAKKSPRS